ncbi:protein PHLOEM PROTEIN 2-LIKE A9-like [Alnus glutinosa]|uniref:protein PHLOEM PROTEIN 2-LIKE A9-like n=1 Tax=Alnus glutinosa TaxID=3517 RepID=UPI002D77C9C0|nr:protein PHLOEM PROTEIN 2-LIKE A9-like [Alnus glutinosa]
MAAKAHYDADPLEQEQELEGGGGYKLYPRQLNIVWGNDPRYWRIPAGKGDTGPAELIQVCWLEVTGSLQLEANKTYEVGFKVSLTPDAFGWNGCPVYVMAKFGKRGKYSWKRATLKTDKAEDQYQIPEQVLSIKSETENTLYFGLYEVWSGKWKGGLKIHEAIIKKK